MKDWGKRVAQDCVGEPRLVEGERKHPGTPVGLNGKWIREPYEDLHLTTGAIDSGYRRSTGLVDVLDRVLDKGLVVAGDIRVSLAEVELLTIRIRLLVCSIDKAEQIGLDWWRQDPSLSVGARKLELENEALRDQIRRLEARVAALAEPAEDTGRAELSGSSAKGAAAGGAGTGEPSRPHRKKAGGKDAG